MFTRWAQKPGFPLVPVLIFGVTLIGTLFPLIGTLFLIGQLHAQPTRRAGLEPLTLAVVAETTATATVLRQPGQQPVLTWAGPAGPIAMIVPATLAPPIARTATFAGDGNVVVFLEHAAPVGITHFGVYWRRAVDPRPPWSFAFAPAGGTVAVKLGGTAGVTDNIEISTRSYTGAGDPVYMDPGL